MYRALAILLAGLLWPCVGWSAQLTDSYVQLYDTQTGAQRNASYQLFFCDESGSIDGTGITGGSADCATDEWSQAIDARWATSMSLRVYEYGSGSVDMKLWDCVNTAANGATDASLVLPGLDDPSLVRSEGDLEPNSAVCTDLTLGNIAGDTLQGTPTTDEILNLGNRTFNYLVVEIENCTGNCDSLTILQLSR